ncbi:hypothetical protein H8E65_06125 [Candidatus Bathyarchaeota archaeon]|nr:hypothetical protein [Candidatus Bathyarchaeota archaeon]MBL7079128.1 hypothetical protein [Candidatus Bathyarchaeota archaeon]
MSKRSPRLDLRRAHWAWVRVGLDLSSSQICSRTRRSSVIAVLTPPGIAERPHLQLLCPLGGPGAGFKLGLAGY